jgi:hypothetical protein
MEEWMVSLGIATVGVVSTFAVIKSKVTRLEIDLLSHESHDERIHEREQNSFSQLCDKVDTSLERLTVLERDTATHLTMPKAEEKFVSKRELELHLKNIELETKHITTTVKSTNDMVASIMGKLEDINKKLIEGH